MSARSSVMMTEEQALDLLRDGMTVGIGGFNTAGHPMSIVRGIIRRGLRGLRVIGGTIGGLELDMMIGAGCVDEVVTSGVTGEALGAVGPFFREAVESGAVRIWESDEGILYAGLRAAGQGLPFLPWKAGIGTSLPELNPDLKVFRDPIHGEELLAVPALRPEVTFLHLSHSDQYGLGQHEGSGYGDRLLHRASNCTVITVDRIVPNEFIRHNPGKTSIANADGVVRAPWGAHPFSSPGGYLVDEVFLTEYVEVATLARRGDREPFERFMKEYITGPADHIEYLERVGIARLVSLVEF